MQDRPVPPPSPAVAYWRQRSAIREAASRLVVLQEAVDHLSNLSAPQWAQLFAFALEFRPTLILELGRQLGNSTCVFTEAANRLPAGTCRVLSLCRSDYWEARTLPRLQQILPPQWFSPLRAELADILTWDYRSLVRADDRVLVFWDAHGFEIAECVLGGLLPLIADQPHVVAMHDLSDARYLAPERDAYGGHRLWTGLASMGTGSRVRLGHVNSEVPQAVAAVDFCARNRIALESADHSFHTEIGGDAGRVEELRSTVGERHFSLGGDWFWFSLNERPGPYTFPAFTPPVVEAPRAWSRTTRLWTRVRPRLVRAGLLRSHSS
jgi:hypothetical protein